MAPKGKTRTEFRPLEAGVNTEVRERKGAESPPKAGLHRARRQVPAARPIEPKRKSGKVTCEQFCRLAQVPVHQRIPFIGWSRRAGHNRHTQAEWAALQRSFLAGAVAARPKLEEAPGPKSRAERREAHKADRAQRAEARRVELIKAGWTEAAPIETVDGPKPEPKPELTDQQQTDLNELEGMAAAPAADEAAGAQT